MIDLTRLNGHRFVVNCDLIKFAEAIPDTTLTLVTGEKLVVRETVDEVVARVALYRAAVLREAWPDAGSAWSAKCGWRAHQHTEQA